MSIGDTSVKKEFRDGNAVKRVSNLVEIYRLLKEKNVPNVDTLITSSTNTEDGHHPHVYLGPVGLDRLPESGLESFKSVVHVLQALKVCYDVSCIRHLTPQVMHSSPDPIYHRDIREPNIIKRFETDGWFLIDWCDASTAPTRGVTHLTESEHSDRVCHNDHGAEVDIWV
jgi:hypothetical protein